jgi:hypothetical protein
LAQAPSSGSASRTTRGVRDIDLTFFVVTLGESRVPLWRRT